MSAWLLGVGSLRGWIIVAVHVVLQLVFVFRALLRPQREPASRLAWVVVILVAPVVGMLAYVFFGETNIGARRIARFRRALARLPAFADIGRHEGEGTGAARLPDAYAHLFRVGESISGFPVVGGNRGELLGDSDDVINRMVADIDAAEGVWTVSQSLLGLPRPTGAKLTGRGEGAVRDAEWQGGVRFREIVTRWQPDRALQWRFSFPDASIRLRTDEHIDPHGRHLWIESGGYDLIPTQDGGTKIRLWTRYRAATPLNAYAAMWGEMILGDIQNNVLAIVAGRIAREKDHE